MVPHVHKIKIQPKINSTQIYEKPKLIRSTNEYPPLPKIKLFGEINFKN